MLVTSFLTRDFPYHCIRTSDSSCYLIGYLAQQPASHGQSNHMYENSAIFQNHTAVMRVNVACSSSQLDQDTFQCHVENKTKIPNRIYKRMACAKEVDEVRLPRIL